MSDDSQPQGRTLQPSGIFQPVVIEDIQTKAETGLYRIRGWGTLRERRWATFDDLTFLPCSLTRIPLEGYREKCSTKTLLGTRFAKKPIELDVPVMITGMSWGALSYNAKVALARGARTAGSSNTTGDGGMLMAERENSRTLIYEVLPSRYGINIHDMRIADAIELTIGQGAKPGTGGLLLGSKVSDVIARQRDLPVGVDQRSPARHPDFLGPDDMVIKIEELREATDWQVPIFVKLGASRVYDDVKLAAKCGADVVVVDGMEGGTGASPDLLQEHTGIPTLAAVCEARAALEEMGLYGVVQLIIAGGIRHGSDAAKALALGADAVYVGTALLIALNCNKPIYVEDYHALGAAPYACHHCHTGRCPVGITTQDPELVARLEIDAASERVANWFHATASEVQILARACGERRALEASADDFPTQGRQALYRGDAPTSARMRGPGNTPGGGGGPGSGRHHGVESGGCRVVARRRGGGSLQGRGSVVVALAPR